MAETSEAETSWLLTNAVVRGHGHVKAGQPCQDYCEVRLSRDGTWMVAAVCDGAGSAKRSDEGARLVSEYVTSRLIDEVPTILERGPGVWLKDRTHMVLLEARQQLRKLGSDIRDFNCTLVGVLVGPTGGFFFHVGDGAAVAARAIVRRERVQEGEAEPDQLYLWDRLTASPPENGQFINETFFVSGDNWDKHLRSTTIAADADIIMLMSDGGMDFVLPQLQLHPAWITPLMGELLHTEDDGARAKLVHEYLAAENAAHVTSDDKTLFVAIRRRVLDLAHHPLSKAAPPAIPRLPLTGPIDALTEDPPKDMSPPDRRQPIRDPIGQQLPPQWVAGPSDKQGKAGMRLALTMSALAIVLSSIALAVAFWRTLPAPPGPLPVTNAVPIPTPPPAANTPPARSAPQTGPAGIGGTGTPSVGEPAKAQGAEEQRKPPGTKEAPAPPWKAGEPR